MLQDALAPAGFDCSCDGYELKCSGRGVYFRVTTGGNVYVDHGTFSVDAFLRAFTGEVKND